MTQNATTENMSQNAVAFNLVVQDPKQTDWLWRLRQRKKQMDRTNNYRKLKLLSEKKEESPTEQSFLSDPNEVEKFLEYGRQDLKSRDIARIKMKENRLSKVSSRGCCSFI